MDEIENPDVSAAGQSVPDSPDDPLRLATEAHEELQTSRPGIDTVEQLGLDRIAPAPAIDPSEPLLEERIAVPQDVPVPSQSLKSSLDGHAASLDNKPQLPPNRVAIPTRPILKREVSAPRPQQALPPAPLQAMETGDVPQDPPDSLTLADLKRIRGGFPNAQPTRQEPLPLEQVYDFEYHDAQAFPVEVEEWFNYSEIERARLRSLQSSFQKLWTQHVSKEEDTAPDWTQSVDLHESFVQQQLSKVKDTADLSRSEAMQALCYVALGVWDETAGIREEAPFRNIRQGSTPDYHASDKGFENAATQMYWMIKNVCMLVRCGVLPTMFEALRMACDRDLSNSLKAADEVSPASHPYEESDVSVEVWCALTMVYVVFEVARLAEGTEDGETVQQEVAAWQQKFLMLCTQVVAQMRWDEGAPIPSSKIFLLLWKTILLCFGGMEDVDEAKESFKDRDEEKDVRGEPVITASPLDYHLFRQELSSKYPAYQPPQPLFPFEPEVNTILPPLRQRQSKLDGVDQPPAGLPTNGINGSSIMHQPVHIATPAPSPPPSPAGPGGKGGKKQNYQTNQMFPFLYPPLDSSSNDLGGKGSTELQDALVGRKWQGSDIPASILEAAELFSKRMRATRAMKQLWEARVDFMKYERGWRQDMDGVDVEKLDLDDSELRNRLPEAKNVPEDKTLPSDLPKTDTERRLAAVEAYYRGSLPYLQSVIIVLLKAVLKHVGDLSNTAANRNGMQNGYQEANGAGQAPPFENNQDQGLDAASSTADQVENTRSQEIAGKALSGILILLLKWFKVSHILRYEYLTQLLLDANYVPLILKLWQTQDIGRACHFKLDRSELNFFHFCRSLSRNPQPAHHHSASASSSDSSTDSAAPPPIRFRRDSSLSGANNTHDPTTNLTSSPDLTSPTEYTHPPEIDELGYPLTPLPSSPITTYSYRNIFTYTNHLRTLQKVTRRKTHRALLLVSYKSSNHLKKSLRVPVHTLRYYTLKLFKSQVPFCGRKWRQSNMKIITAVWLSVPAELRDDWLTGGGGGMGGAGPGDVDGSVEEALPLEQSLRALTHWWNCRMYGDEMGVERGVLDEERDFFRNELERMEGWGFDGFGDGQQEEEGEERVEGEGYEVQNPRHMGGNVEGY